MLYKIRKKDYVLKKMTQSFKGLALTRGKSVIIGKE